jgi:hypothetical protein
MIAQNGEDDTAQTEAIGYIPIGTGASPWTPAGDVTPAGQMSDIIRTDGYRIAKRSREPASQRGRQSTGAAGDSRHADQPQDQLFKTVYRMCCNEGG